jgi:hypothetical protein
MKYIYVSIFALMSLLTVSCGGNDENQDLKNDLTEMNEEFNSDMEDQSMNSDENVDSESSNSESEESSESEGSGDCQSFLNDYEQFMNDYISIIKKMKNNPTDMSIMTEYTEMMTEAGEWTDKTSDCAMDPSFAAKFSKIQLKIANAASGL